MPAVLYIRGCAGTTTGNIIFIKAYRLKLKVTTILLQVYNRIICNFEQLKGTVTMFCIGP